MSYVSNTILDLQKQGRFNEAGYGRMFAYKSSRFNAMIDVRAKAKFIRELNPETYDLTQNQLLYSGPTVFFDKNVDIKNYKIDKMDIRTAYASYLAAKHIKKPGIFRVQHPGCYPVSHRVQLYTIDFNCSVKNKFVKWFLNSSVIQRKKIKTDNKRIWGTISIFSSRDMNLLLYVARFLEHEYYRIVKTITFHGKAAVKADKQQINKLYEMKEHGNKDAKAMLVQSTGWLSLIDKPSYYHMVQYIKFWLLETVYRYKLENDLIGVQTDCIFFRVTEENQEVYQMIKNENLSITNSRSTLGTFKHYRVNYDEIITYNARVVLKNG